MQSSGAGMTLLSKSEVTMGGKERACGHYPGEKKSAAHKARTLQSSMVNKVWIWGRVKKSAINKISILELSLLMKLFVLLQYTKCIHFHSRTNRYLL